MSVDQRRPGLANAFRNKDYEQRMDRHERALATASGGAAAVALDPWHAFNVGSNAAFISSIVNYNQGYQPAGYRKDLNGRVHLKGLVTTLSAIAADVDHLAIPLPVGYRPPARVLLDTIASGAQSRVDILANGQIRIEMAQNAGAYISLDGLYFDTETVTEVPTGPQGPPGPTGGNATVPMDPWHIVGAAGEPAFVAPFSAYQAVGFRKDPLGRVHLKGLVTTVGSAFAFGYTIFTLPAGYRPPALIRMAVEGTNADGSKTMMQVQISAAGVVSPAVAISGVVSGAAGSFIALDELEFDTESVTQMPTGPKGDKGDSGNAINAANFQMGGWANTQSLGAGWSTLLPFQQYTQIDPAGTYTLNADSVTIRDTGWYAISAGAFIASAVNSSITIGTLPATEGFLAESGTPSGGLVDVATAGNFIAAGTKIYVTVNLAGASNVSLRYFQISKQGVGPPGPQGPTGPAGSSVQVPLEAWHTVGAAGEPAFQSSWTNFGGTSAVAEFRKDPLGKVQLRGTIKGGASGTPIFTLPVGYRPPLDILFPTDVGSGGGSGYISISSAGVVSISAPTGITPTTASWLDVARFDTDTVTQFAVGPQGPPGPSTPIQRVTTLPTIGLTEGLEVYLAIPAPTLLTGAQGAVVWHMRYNLAAAKWECVGGPPITFQQEGENNAYQVFAGGSNVTVNAAATKLLAWTFTPPVDVWCEISSWMAIVNKLDANYHYAQISLNCTPAPPVGSPNGTVLQTPTKMQHSGVQTYEPYNWEKIVGLSAGVTYQFYMNFAISGGSWQYHQGSNMLGMNGKAWPR